MLQYWRRIGSKPILLLAIEQLAFNHLSSETFMWKHNTHNPGIGIVCWHCIVCWHSIFFYCGFSTTIIVTSHFCCNCCSVALAGTILNFCPSRFSVKWQEMIIRKRTRREDGGFFFFLFFFFCKASNIRCSKDQWIRSKVKNTIPQTVKSIHYLVRQPSHCVLCIAVCSCGCSY